jgi:hypothetical protein
MKENASDSVVDGIGRARQDTYFSVDIETDGPIPGLYSMLSFAVVQAGYHDGRKFVPIESGSEKYWELRPISETFDPEALRVNGLDRSRLSVEGALPELAMSQADQWIRNRADGRRPVMVASPAAFDWMFMHWYFTTYVGGSPFGYSSCFDVKTAISVKFDRPIAMSGRERLPGWMRSTLPHSHNALDDAREQAQLFANLLEWRGLSQTAAF